MRQFPMLKVEDNGNRRDVPLCVGGGGKRTEQQFHALCRQAFAHGRSPFGNALQVASDSSHGPVKMAGITGVKGFWFWFRACQNARPSHIGTLQNRQIFMVPGCRQNQKLVLSRHGMKRLQKLNGEDLCTAVLPAGKHRRHIDCNESQLTVPPQTVLPSARTKTVFFANLCVR